MAHPAHVIPRDDYVTLAIRLSDTHVCIGRMDPTQVVLSFTGQGPYVGGGGEQDADENGERDAHNG